MTSSLPQSVYIHVPFCVHRCGYCDFTLVAGRDDLMHSYLECMELELNQFFEAHKDVSLPHPIKTLFFGGGTPTHLTEELLDQLILLLRKFFVWEGDCEFSVEANPAELGDGKLKVLQASGVNRISLGVQSFDAEVLKTLERDHSPEELDDVIHRVKKYFNNFSLDLIFGVPGQTFESWGKSIDQALSYQPTHLSTYGLTFEKGTTFWSRKNKGDLVPAKEDLELKMYLHVINKLESNGYSQYEISSFAQNGFRCEHNQIYWTGQSYWAFGPGAASFVDKTRRSNHRSLFTWMKRLRSQESPVAETETLSDEEFARELLILGLRRCQGVESTSFLEKTGYELKSLIGSGLDPFFEAGALKWANGKLQITKKGRPIADSIMMELI